MSLYIKFFLLATLYTVCTCTQAFAIFGFRSNKKAVKNTRNLEKVWVLQDRAKVEKALPVKDSAGQEFKLQALIYSEAPAQNHNSINTLRQGNIGGNSPQGKKFGGNHLILRHYFDKSSFPEIENIFWLVRDKSVGEITFKARKITEEADKYFAISNSPENIYDSLSGGTHRVVKEYFFSREALQTYLTHDREHSLKVIFVDHKTYEFPIKELLFVKQYKAIEKEEKAQEKLGETRQSDKKQPLRKQLTKEEQAYQEFLESSQEDLFLLDEFLEGQDSGLTPSFPGVLPGQF